MTTSRRVSGRALGRLAKALTTDPSEEGLVIDDRYEVVRRIGRGGMSEVFLAKDRKLARVVAVKVLDIPGARWRERFEREARIMKRLRHPGIVPVYDFGTFADGRLYYTMAYVPGKSLDRWAETVDLPRRISTLLAICDVVRTAHDQGVVHRDLKPANLLVDDYGHAYVLDWGIARIGSGAWRTTEGTILGTLPYMPPEQARGQGALIDERCDIFALGAILHELLTGRPRISGMRGEIYQLATGDGPVKPPRAIDPSIPEELETACLRATEGDRERRTPTVQAFASELAKWLAR